MKSTKPLVSIVSINYNQAELTCEMLKSLENITYDNYEIIVVDNCSPTQAPDLIAESYPDVKLIRSEKNLGFPGGNNLGIEHAKGEYILMLNNDTEVEPGFIEPMIELFEQDKSVGMVGSKLHYFDTPNMLQYAGFTPMHWLTLRMETIGEFEIDKGQYDECKETAFVCGASMMTSRKVLQDVGLMADVFFLYYEEHDWCARIKQAGYKVYYQPKSLVRHKASSTTGHDSPLKTYYLNRNRVLYARRNSNKLALVLNYIYLAVVSIPKNTISFIVKKDFINLKAYLRAMKWNLTNYKNLRNNKKIK